MVRFLSVLLCVWCSASVVAQGQVTLLGGAALPGTCIPGQIYVVTGTVTMSLCTATNVWTPVGSGGASAWGGITGTLNNQTDLQTALDAKQAALVSATNIKTINGASVLGSGDLTVSGSAAWGSVTGTLSSQTDLQTALDGKQVSGSYATASQGAKADSALQPAGNGSALTSMTKSQVGLGSVDNTADASKSVSSAATLTTPRTINGVSFNGSANITVTAAGSTLSDNVPVSKLNSGTSASGSTYWRGDGTWATPSGGSGPTFVVTTQDTTNATTSYADITGLSFSVAANTRYRITCILPYDANATTTGIGVGWTGPASPTLTRGFMNSGLTSATVGGTTSVGNDTGGVTTASVSTTNNVAHFEGIWSNGANAGTVQMRVKSEVAVASAIIVRTGAVCSYLTY